jgi:hypothetical protein
MLEFKKLLRAGRTPRVHPNGFIQLDLNDEHSMRLHVWPVAELPDRQKTRHPIHDHSFDMVSTVLTGKLINEMLVFLVPTDYPDLIPNHQEHRGVKIGKEETILKPTGIFGSVTDIGREVILPGQSYRVPAKRFHNSIAEGLTATLMSKLDGEPYNPRVLVPVGVHPDNDFRREQTKPEILWEQIELALAAC